MKRILILMALFGFASFAQAQTENDRFDPETCRCKGKVMIGKVRVVEYGEDLKVRISKHNPQYCGEWELVEHGEDIKIRFVEHGEDIKILYSEIRDYQLKTPQDSRFVN